MRGGPLRGSSDPFQYGDLYRGSEFEAQVFVQ